MNPLMRSARKLARNLAKVRERVKEKEKEKERAKAKAKARARARAREKEKERAKKWEKEKAMAAVWDIRLPSSGHPPARKACRHTERRAKRERRATKADTITGPTVNTIRTERKCKPLEGGSGSNMASFPALASIVNVVILE